MKFQISRASNDYTKPHDKAVAKNGLLGNVHWFIEVDTLEELLQLMGDVNDDIVLSNNMGDYNGIPLILIYDDYIE